MAETDYYRHVACDDRTTIVRSSALVRFETIRGNTTGTISWRLRQPALTLYWWHQGFAACRVDVAGERVSKHASGDLGIALVPPDASSFGEFDIPGSCSYDVAFLEPLLLEQVDMAFGDVPLICFADDVLKSGMRDLSGWRHDATFGLMAEGWALQAVARIGQVLGSRPMSETAALGRGQIGQVQAFVADNLEQHLGLSELAAVAGVPASDFAAAFRRRTGMTPAGYVRIKRMEMARRLLAMTEWSVGRIAVRAGFDDAVSFSRSFRASEGLSPEEVRIQRS
ncbi:AraC family transcriptional regulator [Sphingomonas sp. NFR15]|uniref:AraC family transcriptional regulator n=1 Tax=Sphingomonas sp. NFR15 TaxID=1566282 RepID=UPI0015A19104|nr:AraC family transcriptional regulator [Sphingomonas sp. NFR15]